MRSLGQRHEGQYRQIKEGYERETNFRTSLDSRSWNELRSRAEELGIEGVQKLSKKELVHAIRTRSGSGSH